jgi:GAF domain-containing protein
VTAPFVIAERPSDEALLKTFSHAGEGVVSEVQELAKLAARAFGASMALVGYLEGDRLWYSVTVGIGKLADESLGRTLAELVVRERDVFVLEDLRDDPRFARSALVAGPGGARFLAGAPLVAASGRKLGVLSVVDGRPRAATPDEIDGLRVLARQVLAQLELAHAREMLECIFRQSGEGIVVVDENGAPQILNAEARTRARRGSSRAATTGSPSRRRCCTAPPTASGSRTSSGR